MIALNSLLLILDMPSLSDPYQQTTIKLMLNIISIIFCLEFLLRVIVQGFYFGEKTYLKDNWNILDFIIVVFSVMTWILESTANSGDIQFVRAFRALRALRPLRVVSKNEGIKTVVNSLLESIPALLNVLLIVLLFLMVFGILGIQLFKGMLGSCNDSDPSIQWKKDCEGWFKVEITDEKDDIIGWKREKRIWSTPFNQYDNIMSSMITFFEISTLEMWPD